MFEQVIYLVLGAVLAIAGGFLQSIYNVKKERANHLQIKREEAYLGYIEALINLRENQNGAIDFKKYFPKYDQCKAQILLYGSEQVKKRIKGYDSWLYECFEVGFNVNDVITEIDNIVLFIRKEIGVL